MENRTRAIGDAVRRIYTEFCRNAPAGARSRGGYRSDGRDRFALLAPHDRHGNPTEVANGVYRLEGSEWLLTFNANRLVGVEVATPENEFGGSRVVTVSAHDRDFPPIAVPPLPPRQDPGKPLSVTNEESPGGSLALGVIDRPAALSSFRSNR